MAEVRDLFAEMYVAGVLADAGWNIYFPTRDEGFDLIATKVLGEDFVIRPVQVKGLYPTDEKTRKAVYGYVGRLSAIHEEMVLALVYFPTSKSKSPKHIAWMPVAEIKTHSRGFRCQPASYDGSGPAVRRDFMPYFDQSGLVEIDSQTFKNGRR